MSAAELQTDYLVIGGGATAMAFVDTLLSEDAQATVTMVDRHHRPGGHWNDAYPFVRLHQPAAWYGVASRELGGGVDSVGPNAGLHSLASGAEVLAHFDQVLSTRYMASGRVLWRPMSEVRRGTDGSPQIVALLSGETQAVRVRRKTVNATHARTEVPGTHPPKYAVAPEVECVPLNRLPEVSRPYAAYTVVGSGKTGIDACLWLLENGVPPERIRWVMPRDAWFMDRANMQPGLEHFERNMAFNIQQFEAIAEAHSVPELFARLEACGALLRMDQRVEPSTYRCAVVSRGELAQLRRIEDIVRLGRVRALEPGRLVLDGGSVAARADTLYVDCSASAIQPLPGLPVFDGDTVNLFMVRFCQPAFSAALIAYVEAHFTDPRQQNELCGVVPSPELPLDWLRLWLATLANMGRWRQQPALMAWMMQCRLNGQAVMMRGVRPDDAARMALVKASGMKAAAAVPRLLALLAGAT